MDYLLCDVVYTCRLNGGNERTNVPYATCFIRSCKAVARSPWIIVKTFKNAVCVEEGSGGSLGRTKAAEVERLVEYM